MTHPNVALVAKAYQALNRRDLDGFMSAFADDAVLYGADGQIEGREAILSVIRQLIGLSENSLEIDVHDILANDAPTRLSFRPPRRSWAKGILKIEWCTCFI